MIDGVEYFALGINDAGAKTTLGFHQESTENQEISDRLLSGLADRG